MNVRTFTGNRALMLEEPEVLVHAVPVGTLFLGTLVSSFAFAAASATTRWMRSSASVASPAAGTEPSK